MVPGHRWVEGILRRMPDLATRAALVPLVWIAGFVLLSWPVFPAPARRWLALAASGAGIGFLVKALGTEGLRDAPITTVYLMGAPAVTGHAFASASLPWYVVTAVCLLLGTVGLAASDAQVGALARHPVSLAVALSLGVTAVRFTLEKVAAPPALSWAVGVTWLAPVVGAVLARRVLEDGGGWKGVLGALLRYAYGVRLGIALLMVVASLLHLGTHYDVSRFVSVADPWTGETRRFEAGSFRQVLELAILPQLTFWPLYTMFTGLLGSFVTYAGSLVTNDPFREAAKPKPSTP
jgi:hypothetical protein